MAEDYSQDESSDDGDGDQSSESSDGEVEHDKDQLDGKLSTVEFKSAPGTQTQTIWTVLYIQMEYCRPEVGLFYLVGFAARTIGQSLPIIKFPLAAFEYWG